jgi:CTP synthase
VGKYVELRDAYISVREALKHAAIANDVVVEIVWVQSSDLDKDDSLEILRQVDGIVVPGGFGSRGVDGMIRVANYARVNQVPYLGLSLGMQVMVIDFARDVLQLETANSSEFDPSTPAPVIDQMIDPHYLTKKSGTMRLGLYPCQLQTGTIAHQAYQKDRVEERHRNRFEVNNEYRPALEQAGLICSGISPDGKLVEIIEIKDHPFMLGTQFHPEFLSRPNRPHPLFDAFIRAVNQKAEIDQ